MKDYCCRFSQLRAAEYTDQWFELVELEEAILDVRHDNPLSIQLLELTTHERQQLYDNYFNRWMDSICRT